MKTHMLPQFLPRPSIAQAVGGTYNQAIRTLGYWSAVNSTIILVLGWDSSIGLFLKGVFPWLTFPMFVGMVITAAILVGLIDLMFVLPAVYAFGNKQATIHANPIFQKLEEMQEEGRKRDKKIEELEALIGNDLNMM